MLIDYGIKPRHDSPHGLHDLPSWNRKPNHPSGIRRPVAKRASLGPGLNREGALSTERLHWPASELSHGDSTSYLPGLGVVTTHSPDGNRLVTGPADNSRTAVHRGARRGDDSTSTLTFEEGVHDGFSDCESDGGCEVEPEYLHAAGQPSDPSLYEPLDQSKFETRLLEIETSENPNEIVRCKLLQVSLVTPPEYCALSYHWGDQKAYQPIEVNGLLIWTTENLALALVELRKRAVKVVWVDALCINQQDLYERASQIQHMGLIFSRAIKVIAWLGPERNNSDVGMYAIRKLSADLRWKYDLVGGWWEYRMTESESSSVYRLMDRPYWRRKCFIQELAKAQEVDIWCGRASLPLSDLLHAHSESPRAVSTSQNTPEILTAIKIFAEQEGPIVPTEPRTRLARALFLCSSSIATDARDYIYALLGLTDDGRDLVPMPNYLEPTEAIFTRTALHMMQYQGHVSLILLARRSSCARLDLPSWVPDWTNTRSTAPAWVVELVQRKVSSTLRRAHKALSLVPGRADLLRVRGRRIGIANASGPHITGRGYQFPLKQATTRASPSYPEDWLAHDAERALWRVVDALAPSMKGALDKVHDSRKALTIAELVVNSDSETNQYFSSEIGRRATSLWSQLGRTTVSTEPIAYWSSKYLAAVKRKRFIRLKVEELNLFYAIDEMEKLNIRLTSSMASLVDREDLWLAAEGTQGDWICRLDNCEMSVVLRPKSNGYFTFVGEAHNISEVEPEAKAETEVFVIE